MRIFKRNTLIVLLISLLCTIIPAFTACGGESRTGIQDSTEISLRSEKDMNVVESNYEETHGDTTSDTTAVTGITQNPVGGNEDSISWDDLLNYIED